MIARAYEQSQLWVEISVGLAYRTLIVHGLAWLVSQETERGGVRVGLTKYSVVLPDASLIPPPNIVEEVLWT